MGVTLERTQVPAMHRSYPGFWVDVDGDPLGLVYQVTHLVGETWYALRWHDTDWHGMASKAAAVDWIAATARRR